MVSQEGSSPGPAQALPGARHALVLLLLINLFNYIDRQVLAAVETDIENSFFPETEITYAVSTLGLLAMPGDTLGGALAGNFFPGRKENYRSKTTEAKIGSLNTAFMVSYMLIAPLFGWLADRMGRWLLIGVGVLLWTVASGGSGWAATFAVLFITRCFVGIGEAAYGPSAPTVIADFYPVEQRGAKLAWFYAAIPVGSALGYVLGGLVAVWTGNWRWAFYIVVVPGLVLGLWCFWMRDPPRGQSDPGMVGKKASLGDYWTILRTPSYLLNTLGMTAMTFAMGSIAFWMPRFVWIEKGWGDKGQVNVIFGLILVVAGLGSTMLGGWAGDKLRARYGGAYFLVSGLAMLAGFPFVLLVLWLPFPLAWVFVFLACFCLFFNTGPTNTILANVTHPSVRASAFALNILIIHALGDAVSPALIGLINGYHGMKVGFLAVSFMFLVAGVFWLWGCRYLQRDTELAPTRG